MYLAIQWVWYVFIPSSSGLILSVQNGQKMILSTLTMKKGKILNVKSFQKSLIGDTKIYNILAMLMPSKLLALKNASSGKDVFNAWTAIARKVMDSREELSGKL